MRNIEIQLPPDLKCDAVERAIDELISHSELQASLRGTLKQYPGCIHWHVKTQDASGTLEITLWPQEHRAWFSVQSGRTASWIDGALDRLAESLRQRFWTP